MTWYILYPSRDNFEDSADFYAAPTYVAEAADISTAFRVVQGIDKHKHIMTLGWERATLPEALDTVSPTCTVHAMADGVVVPMWH